MSDNDIQAVWTPDDLRRVITMVRALGCEAFDEPAPVIDLFTRERIA